MRLASAADGHDLPRRALRRLALGLAVIAIAVAAVASHHHDLAHAMPIRDLDRKRQAMLRDLDPVTGPRHAADAVVDQAADGVVLDRKSVV